MDRFIIPAAGFGKRVGSPNAKELLFFEKESKPLLYYALDLAKEHGFQPVVISRNDKEELNEELFKIQKEYNLEICLIEHSQEWPDTIRQSQKYWAENNILVLPDSRFYPTDIISKIKVSLEENDLSFATFEVPELKTWGVVGKKESSYFICEKPQEPLNALAWGLIGFKKNMGEDLFDKLHRSSLDNACRFLNTTKVEFITLDSYQDITRDPSGLSAKSYLR